MAEYNGAFCSGTGDNIAYAYYKLSWDNNIIALTRLSDNVVILQTGDYSAYLIDNFPINKVSISSGFGGEAYWDIVSPA